MALICGLFQGTTHNMFLATHRAAWTAGALPANYVSRTVSSSTATGPQFLDARYIEMNAEYGSNSASTRMAVDLNTGTAYVNYGSVFMEFWVYLPASAFSGTGITSAETARLVSMGSENPLSSTGVGNEFEILVKTNPSTALVNKRTGLTSGFANCSIEFILNKLELDGSNMSAVNLVALQPSDSSTFAGWCKLSFWYSNFSNVFGYFPYMGNIRGDYAIGGNSNNRQIKSVIAPYNSTTFYVLEDHFDNNIYNWDVNPTHISYGTIQPNYAGDKLRLGPVHMLAGGDGGSEAFENYIYGMLSGTPALPRGRLHDGFTSQVYYNWVGATDADKLTGTGAYGPALTDDTTGSLTTGSI